MTTPDEIEEIVSRPMTDEEKYYEEMAFKDPAESMGRIEDTAKFLTGIASATSGLYLAACKLALGRDTVSDMVWFAPFLFWALSIIFLILVIFPRQYPTFEKEPASFKRAILKAQKVKYTCLSVGTFFFICGILSGVLPFR